MILKSFFFILMFMILCDSLLSQEGVKYSCPLIKGKQLVAKERWKDWGIHVEQAEITSERTTVFSSSMGQITAIDSSVGHSFSIGVKSSDTIFIYDNLASTSCLIGQTVYPGQPLGEIKKGTNLLFRVMFKSEYLDIRKIISCKVKKIKLSSF